METDHKASLIDRACCACMLTYKERAEIANRLRRFEIHGPHTYEHFVETVRALDKFPDRVIDKLAQCDECNGPPTLFSIHEMRSRMPCTVFSAILDGMFDNTNPLRRIFCGILLAPYKAPQRVFTLCRREIAIAPVVFYQPRDTLYLTIDKSGTFMNLGHFYPGSTCTVRDVRTVRVTSPNVSVRLPEWLADLPNLRSICFSDCSDMDAVGSSAMLACVIDISFVECPRVRALEELFFCTPRVKWFRIDQQSFSVYEWRAKHRSPHLFV